MKKRAKKPLMILKCKLGFTLHDITMSKEESVTIKIIKTFSNEKILPQNSVLAYQIDLNFLEHKLAIEVDEKGHTDRDEKKENEREEKIKKELGCKFIRINPDAENYIFVDIGKIQNHIIESTKKSLIDDLSTTLLAFKFKSNHSIKSKCLMDCQKLFTKLQKMKNAQSEIKLIKIGTRLETTYCFGCKDFTLNFRPQKVKMTNKGLRKM